MEEQVVCLETSWKLQWRSDLQGDSFRSRSPREQSNHGAKEARASFASPPSVTPDSRKSNFPGTGDVSMERPGSLREPGSNWKYFFLRRQVRQ